MPAGVELFVVALALAAAACATTYALRARAQLRADALAFRLARERETAFVAGARRLGVAARRGVAEVRSEIDRAIRALATSVDTVLIFDEDEDALVCVTATGVRCAYFAGTRIARSEGSVLPVRALAAGHRVGLTDGGTRSFHPADVTAFAVPLPREAGSMSVVYVASRQFIDASAIDALVTLIDHAGFAYALANERESDRRQAEFDGLTGLLTPRAFRDRLTALIDRARYAPLARIALLFVDTDHFKAWNDCFGHASGDALLRALARTLHTSTFGAEELVARNGGDEFCLVFTETEKSHAIERAEALRQRVAAMDFASLRGPDARSGIVVTASIGVAAYPADAASANDLLERADAAMYHSKRSGRNAVSYFDIDGVAVRVEGEGVSPDRHNVHDTNENINGGRTCKH